jgi:DnaJ-class molecular chaperone
MARNYYVILGVGSDATLDEIKTAFRRRALELHPDRSGRESEPFIELQEAYGVLSDPERRRRYDRQVAGQRPRRRPWGPAAEALVTRPIPEPLRTVRPAGSFRDVRLDESFRRFEPSFDELFDRLWSNFTTLSRPKAEALESLTVEVVLTPEEARTGGAVRVEIPALATCPACGGHGAVEAYGCWRCVGQGYLTVHYPVSVSYPAGVADGYVAQVPLEDFGVENFYLTVQFRVSAAVPA